MVRGTSVWNLENLSGLLYQTAELFGNLESVFATQVQMSATVGSTEQIPFLMPGLSGFLEMKGVVGSWGFLSHGWGGGACV